MSFWYGGASALAAIFRIPPLVIGLTVIAFGTSAPELAVSVQAVYAGSAGYALVMTGFVLPLTVVTLIVCMLRASHASPTSSD